MPDLASWFEQISAMSPLAFAVVALAGLTMGVAPSSFPMFSIIVGYVAGQALYERNRFTRGLEHVPETGEIFRARQIGPPPPP